MRRHPKRLTPKEDAQNVDHNPRRAKWTEDIRPRRGPKKRQKAWPLLNYTIDKGVGVVFHAP